MGKVSAMKKVIVAAIAVGIVLAAALSSTFSANIPDGLSIGLTVVALLAGSSLFIAVKDRKRHAWH